MILGGDVGGTKIHLALYEWEEGRPLKRRETLLSTADTASPAEAVGAFVADAGERVEACALGVAGPVVHGEVDGTNLPWVVRAAEISRAIGGSPVRLLNDLEASAHGLHLLEAGDLSVLQEGRADPGANRALVSPGTGLGECVVADVGGRAVPVGFEGGHADFAPRNDEESELLRYLRGVWRRVSMERVVSGPGIVNVYCFLRDTGAAPDDLDLGSRPGDSAAAAAISEAALRGGSSIAREALRIWTGAFGSHAGNVALRGYTTGGVFLGGGIPARIRALLQKGPFLDAFREKEPHSGALRAMPIRVILNPETTLLGSAAVAAYS